MNDTTNDKAREEPDAAAGVPQSTPPEGGPDKDENTPSPADLTPGFGGTARTKPASTSEDDEDESKEDGADE